MRKHHEAAEYTHSMVRHSNMLHFLPSLDHIVLHSHIQESEFLPTERALLDLFNKKLSSLSRSGSKFLVLLLIYGVGLVAGNYIHSE